MNYNNIVPLKILSDKSIFHLKLKLDHSVYCKALTFKVVFVYFKGLSISYYFFKIRTVVSILQELIAYFLVFYQPSNQHCVLCECSVEVFPVFFYYKRTKISLENRQRPGLRQKMYKMSPNHSIMLESIVSKGLRNQHD